MINALMTAIWDALKADNSLMTALSGVAGNNYKCYNVTAPQGTAFPFLVFTLLSDTPINTFNELSAINDAAVQVLILSDSASAKECGTIYDLLDAVLQGQALSVSGYGHLKTHREYLGTPLFDPETRIYELPVRYRIWIDKT